MAGNPTTPLPAVRVAWRPEQHNRVSNGTFETNTTGWATTAGINAAGTSITRITTDFHSGSASASVVCSATDTSGVNFDFGSETFFKEGDYGAVYVAVVWLKRVSGSRRARITLGSEGTSSDRATLTITDLPDAWTPYSIRWLPTATRTDVQLAITNGSAEAVTFRVDDVAVYLLDGFSQVENGSFEVDTTGWVTFSSGAVARSTAEAFGGSACMRITASTTANSGARFLMGGRFLNGRTYRARIGAKHISGVSAVWEFGFLDGTSGYTSTTTFTATSDFAWYTFDATLAADQSDLRILIRHPAASTAVLAVDEVEVYEASDDLGTDAGPLSWSRSLDAIGTATVEVLNTSGKYDPRYSSSALYGSVSPGKRLWIRSTYASVLYGCFYGTITTVEPRPWDGVVDLVCEDMMGSLAGATHASRFYADATYSDARARAIGALLTDDPRNESTTLGSSRVTSNTKGLEGSTFYAGTDDLVNTLEYLRDLNEATQTAHWCKPSPHAMVGWRYTVEDRGALTDTSSDHTVNESNPPADLTGVRYTHEALENQQVVPWQGFELGPLAPDHYPWFIDGLDILAMALTRDNADALGYRSDEENPYLHFTREVYGDNSDIPEPSYRILRRFWKKRKKGRKLVTKRRRIYPDAFVPIDFATGDVRVIAIDLALPVQGMSVGLVSNPDTPNRRYIERTPQRLVVEYTAFSATAIEGFYVIGTPYTPLDEQEAQVTYRGSGTAIYSGPSFSTPYIPSQGAAEGIGAYRNWRYSEARMRPAITDRNNRFTADLTDHITVTLDRWRLSSVLFAVTGTTWAVTQTGVDWTVTRDLEEIPSHTAWFTLDSSALDGSDVLAY